MIVCVTCRNALFSPMQCDRCGLPMHRACGRRTACPASSPTSPCLQRHESSGARRFGRTLVKKLIRADVAADLRDEIADLSPGEQRDVLMELRALAQQEGDHEDE